MSVPRSTVFAMWGNVAGSVISGIVLTLVAHFIARGSRRFRLLSVARHELEVAELLDDAPELAVRVRQTAHARLERYLAPPATERHAAILSGVVAAVVASVALIVGIGLVGDDDVSQWPMQFVVGACSALVWHIVRWCAKPVIHRALSCRRDVEHRPPTPHPEVKPARS